MNVYKSLFTILAQISSSSCVIELLFTHKQCKLCLESLQFCYLQNSYLTTSLQFVIEDIKDAIANGTKTLNKCKITVELKNK